MTPPVVVRIREPEVERPADRDRLVDVIARWVWAEIKVRRMAAARTDIDENGLDAVGENRSTDERRST